MLYKTKGIVLNTLNYNDKYILVGIYTEMFGQVTYMVSKAKGHKTKVPRSVFFPFAVVELEVDHQPRRDIQRIKEAHAAFHYYSIPIDMVKTSMVFFLSEFLTRVLRDTQESQLVFDFIFQSAQVLEMKDKNIANFHLVFMLKLTTFLGFYPNLEEYNRQSLFDMLNGEFVITQPMHRHFLTRNDSQVLHKFARMNYENMHHFVFNRSDRVTITDRILEYYRLHLYDFPMLKSLQVLHELF